MGCLKIPYHPGEGIEEYPPLKICKGLKGKETSLKKCNDYYPFGLTFNTSERSGFTSNLNLYQSKEWQQDLGLDTYDFEARMYDPALGRTFQKDPHSENYYEWSPYSWSGNSPIMMVDPTGMDWYVHSESGDLHWYNGAYEDDKTPEGYERLGDDNYFGEESFERLQLAKENHLDATGEALTSMSFNDEQSGLLAKEFGFKKVPTYRFVDETATRSFVVQHTGGFQKVSENVEGTRINEKFTYVPKDFVSIRGLKHTIDWNPPTGFSNHEIYVEEIRYKKQNIIEKAFSKFQETFENNSVPYYSEIIWADVKPGHKFYKYRPDGKIRRRLRF